MDATLEVVQMKQDFLVGLKRSLKNNKVAEKILGNSFIFKSNENEITSDLHWVGKDRASQMIVVLVDGHLNGNATSVLAQSVYHIVDELILQEERVYPARLLMEIQGELRNQNFAKKVSRYANERVRICVLAIDDKNDNASYAANYNAIQAFDSNNSKLQDVASSGSFSLNSTNKVFASTIDCNNTNMDGESLNALIAGSIDLEMAEQYNLLRQKISDTSELEEPNGFTLIGLDFSTMRN